MFQDGQAVSRLGYIAADGRGTTAGCFDIADRLLGFLFGTPIRQHEIHPARSQLSCDNTPDPFSAAPVSGNVSDCEVEFSHEMTVTLEDRRYVGKYVVQTANSSGVFGVATTTVTKQASALLLGESGGQIRCDFGFDPMWTHATGVCVDSKSMTYDLLIRN